jgi:hypothetical protein
LPVSVAFFPDSVSLQGIPRYRCRYFDLKLFGHEEMAKGTALVNGGYPFNMGDHEGLYFLFRKQNPRVERAQHPGNQAQKLATLL